MDSALNQMAVFARTVEEGSFRGAAKVLNLSPSVVSHHVSELEVRLGVALLYRSTRRLSLTSEGEVLFDAARRMLAAAEGGVEAVTAEAGEPVGTLRITVPAVLAASPVLTDIAAFRADHPRVRLDLNFSDIRRDVIGEGFDVAIRMGWLKDSTLKMRKLGEARRLLAATPDYMAGHAAPRTPADLEELDWLHLSSAPRRPAFRQKGRKPVTLAIEPGVTVDDAIALTRLATAGLGLAIVTEFLAAEDIAAGRLVSVLPDWTLEPVGIYAVWPPNAPRRGLTARFVSFMADRAKARAADAARTRI